MTTVIDLTGRTFGRLTVTRRVTDLLPGKRTLKGESARWECKCSCGQTTTVRSDALRRGTTRSCGCLKANQQANYWGKRLHAVSVLLGPTEDDA